MTDKTTKADLLGSTALTTPRGMFRTAMGMVGRYFTAPKHWKKAWLLFAATIGLSYACVEASVKINQSRGIYMKGLKEDKADNFYKGITQFTVYALGWVLAMAYKNKIQQSLQLDWRVFETQRYLNTYLNKQAYHDIQQNGTSLTDNPDQRITEDLKIFTEKTLDLSLGLIDSGLTLATFTGVLYALSPRVEMLGMQVPYLVPVAFGYAGVGTYLIRKIGKKLPTETYKQQKLEADFRAAMMRLKENTESVAIYKGESVEKNILLKHFKDVAENAKEVIDIQKRVTIFSSLYGQTAAVLPLGTIAPSFFAKKIAYDDMFDAAGAFGDVRESLSFLVSSFRTYAEWKATTQRLTHFENSIREAHAKSDQKAKTINVPGRVVP